MALDEHALTLFNEKAEKLRGSTFARKVFTESYGVQVSGEIGKPGRVKRTGPTREEMEAAALTLRFFVQDNEPCSLRNLAMLYPTLNISQHLKDNYQDCRKKINQFLDAQTDQPSLIYGGKTTTNREVFKVYFWGDMAHSHRKEVYDRWKGNPIPFAITENMFVEIVARVLDAIFYLVGVNNEALKELGEPPVPTAFPLRPSQ